MCVYGATTRPAQKRRLRAGRSAEGGGAQYYLSDQIHAWGKATQHQCEHQLKQAIAFNMVFFALANAAIWAAIAKANHRFHPKIRFLELLLYTTHSFCCTLP